MINSLRGKRVVDLCIYVDLNVYKENHNTELIFDALYNIVYALTMKSKFFHDWNDYNNFSLDYASRLYFRLTNPKQFLPDDNPLKLKKIKSILNYIKKTIHPARVDYQQHNYSLQFNSELHNKTVLSLLEFCINSCKQQNKSLFAVDFEYYLIKITKTIKYCIQLTPYCEDKLMSHKLYISCLMTLINLITLNNFNKKRFAARLKNGYNVEDFIDRAYLDEQLNSVKTFHLPQNMQNFVTTLVNQIKKLIAKDLNMMIGSYEPSDALVQSIIASSFGDINYDQE